MSDLYLEPLQAYLKDLCVRNKILLHTDASNKVYIRFQTEEQLSAIKNNASRYFVVLDDFSGQATGEPDEAKLRMEVTILFLKRTNPPAGDPNGAISKAQDDALAILFQFYAKLKQDKYEDDCGVLEYLRPEQMTLGPVPGPVDEFHYGWWMTIPYDTNAPDFDENDWNAPLNPDDDN